MAFFQFLCPEKDNIIEELRRTFNATPLAVPDAQTQPLQVVAHRGRKTTIWGPLDDLLQDSDNQLNLRPEMAQVANVNVNKTGRFNTDFGIKLLDGLLGGFNVSMNPLKVALEDVEEISLNFENVRRRYLPISTIGNELAGRKINRNNPATHIFTPQASRQFGMYLVSSILESNKFAINLEKAKKDTLEVEAEVLKKLGEGNMQLTENKEHKKALVFEGEKPLTFAFSCIELLLTPDGSLRFGEEKILSKDADGNVEVTVKEKPTEVSFIAEEAPAMLGWNSRAAILNEAK